MAAAVNRGRPGRAASLVGALPRAQLAAIAVIAALTMIAALALVDRDPSEAAVALEETADPSKGFSMLLQAGLSDVVAAKKEVKQRQLAKNRLAAEVSKDRADLHHAQAARDAVRTKAETLATKVDHESHQVSDLTARSETYGDVIGERQLKAREEKHVEERARRRATSLANEARHNKAALKSIQHDAKTMSKRAASELKAAMARGVDEADLKAVARKHLDQAKELKQRIQGQLHRQIASLRSSIDSSKHAALRATEAAKHEGKAYARLLAKYDRHHKAAQLAQKQADSAALAVAEAEKQAELDAGRVAASLRAAGESKKEMEARLRAAQHVPKAATTLHTGKHVPKVLTGQDKPLGGQQSSRAEQHAKDEEQVADARIKRLEAAKAAAAKVVEKERSEAERIKRLLAKQQHEEQRQQHAASQAPAAADDRNDDQEYNAAQQYLNRGAGVQPGPGAVRAVDAVEGSGWHIGTGGRDANPELDAMASANNKDYQQQVHDEDVANNQDDDEYGRNDPMDTNIF